jgi:exodeoxyribonuclease V alpha subunit
MLVIAAERASRNNNGALTYGFGELDEWLPPVPPQSARAKVRLSRLIIPLLTQHYAMLQRNLLYTGVSRGKRLVVLVGQKKAIAIAVRNVSGRRR